MSSPALCRALFAQANKNKDRSLHQRLLLKVERAVVAAVANEPTSARINRRYWAACLAGADSPSIKRDETKRSNQRDRGAVIASSPSLSRHLQQRKCLSRRRFTRRFIGTDDAFNNAPVSRNV